MLEWTPEEASLLQDRSFSAAASVYISREAWEAQNHQTFSSISLLGRGQDTLYETCACVIHTNLQLHYYYPVRACAARGYVIGRGLYIYIYTYISTKKISEFFESFKILTFQKSTPVEHAYSTILHLS